MIHEFKMDFDGVGYEIHAEYNIDYNQRDHEFTVEIANWDAFLNGTALKVETLDENLTYAIDQECERERENNVDKWISQYCNERDDRGRTDEDYFDGSER